MLCISGNKGQVLKGIYLLNTFSKICDMWAPSDIFFSFSDWSWEWSVLWWLCFFKELTDWENGLTKSEMLPLGNVLANSYTEVCLVFSPNCACFRDWTVSWWSLQLPEGSLEDLFCICKARDDFSMLHEFLLLLD